MTDAAQFFALPCSDVPDEVDLAGQTAPLAADPGAQHDLRTVRCRRTGFVGNRSGRRRTGYQGDPPHSCRSNVSPPRATPGHAAARRAGAADVALRPPEQLDIDAFLNRVAARENVGVATARLHAALVLSVLARAIGPDELNDIAATLPKDFAPLLPRGPDIEVRPVRMLVTEMAKRCGLDAVGARRAIEAVLETLAESIAPGEIDELIAWLPIELHPVLKAARARNPGRASPISLETFTRRVAQREGTDLEHAAQNARPVLTTLRGAIGDEEFFDSPSNSRPSSAPCGSSRSGPAAFDQVPSPVGVGTVLPGSIRPASLAPPGCGVRRRGW
jgi:uncharacterized protein (DUF2267 family)